MIRFRVPARGILLTLLVGLAGCASSPDEPIPSAVPVPLDQRLSNFAALHGRRDHVAMRTCFAEGAILTSPSLPKKGSPDDYIRTFLAEPFNMEAGTTEILYMNDLGAKTRTNMRLFAPAKYSLTERVEILWKFENGAWKIFSIEYNDWPPVVGTWRKAALRGEPSMELRILPGGTYLVYADNDRSLPTFRGTYSVAAGRITLNDTSAADSGKLDNGSGRYAVVVTANSADFRKLNDDNRWREDRFEGIWTGSAVRGKGSGQ